MSDIDIEHLRSLGNQKVTCKASQLAQLIEAAAAKDAEIEAAQMRANGNADAFEKLMTSYQTLRAWLAAAEAALRPIADAASDLDDNESGEIWERPAAMSIDCDHLRAAAAYFATMEAPHE